MAFTMQNPFLVAVNRERNRKLSQENTAKYDTFQPDSFHIYHIYFIL